MQLPIIGSGTDVFWIDPSKKFVNFDSSGNVKSVIDRHTGTAYAPYSNNMPTWKPNLLGKYTNEGNGQPGFVFNGSQSMRISIPNNHVLNGTGKQMMYIGACQPTAFTPSGTNTNVVCNLGGSTAATAGYFVFEFFNTGGNGCDIERGDDASNQDNSGIQAADTNLHIYTAIYDGYNMILRIDGIQKLKTAAVLSAAGYLTINQLAIGDYTDGSFPAFPHSNYIGNLGMQVFYYGNPIHVSTEVEDYMAKLYGL